VYVKQAEFHDGRDTERDARFRLIGKPEACSYGLF
jgi:hypothetical protein